MFTHHETQRYTLIIDKMGHCLIRRSADKAEVYLQGDDSLEFRKNVDRLDISQEQRALSDNRYNILFDLMCSDYDEQMEVRA